MMGKRSDEKRLKRSQKRAAKREAMKRPGAQSKYAKKRAEQVNGTFRSTSPFEAIDSSTA